MSVTRTCTQCGEPKSAEEMSWRRGWCLSCEAARVRGYLDQRRAELGDDEFKAQRATAARARRQRRLRSSK